MFIVLGVLTALFLPAPFNWNAPIALLFGYPVACMMVAINQGGLLDALNPLKWLQGATQIGWSYVAILLLTLAFGFSHEYLGSYLTDLPIVPRVFLTSALSYYFSLVSFFLLGYAVYQYQDELGFEQSQTPTATAKSLPLPLRADPDQALLNECESMVQAGNMEAAAERLGKHIKMAGGTVVVHERYRKLLGVLDDQKALREHTQLWLAILLAQEKWQDAAKLYEQQISQQVDFVPQEADLWSPVARALESSRADLAMQLLQKFHVSFPRSKKIPQHWLQAAQIMVRKKRDYAAGCKMIAQIRSRFPDSPYAEDLNRQEAEWLKLSGQTAASAIQ